MPLKDKVKRQEYKKLWYEKNKERILKIRKQYHIDNIDIIREKKKIYASLPENKIEALCRSRKFYHRHKEEIAQWRDDHREESKEYFKKYKQDNKEKVNHHSRLRSYRKKGAEGSHTLEEWNDLKKEFNNMCLSCKLQEPEITLTRDHVLPIISSGTNYIDNIQPLCRRCNSIKGTKEINYKLIWQNKKTTN